MRRLTLPALAAALLFTACGTADDGDESPSGAENDLLPTVEGDFGEEPTITYPADGPSQELEVAVLIEGDGAEVAAGDALVADYAGQVWDGATFDNSFTRSEPAMFPIGVGNVIQGWDEGLVGQSIGSRVLLSIPSELGYPEGQPSAGIEKGDTLVFVVDIVDSFGPTSAGDPDAEVAAGAFDDLPIDIDGEVGEPVQIAIKDGAAKPNEPSVSVLAEGNGKVLEPGPTALHYALVPWGDMEGESSWDAEKIVTANLGDGTTFFDLLIGEKVGSRALILTEEIADDAEAPDTPAMAVIVDIVGQPTR